MANVLERVRLVGELGKAAADLRAAESPIAKIKAGAAVRALLERLGAGAPAVPALTLDRKDAEASKTRLRDYFETGLASVPGPLQPFEAEMVAGLARGLGDSDLSERARARAGAIGDPEKLAAFNLVSSRGVAVSFDRAELLGKIQAREAVQSKVEVEKRARIEEVNSQINALNAEVAQELKRLNAKLREVNEAIRAGNAHPNDQDAIFEAMERLQASHRARYAELKREFDARASESVDTPGIGQPELRSEGKVVIDAVLAASKVTEAQAKEWASRQPVAKATLAFLKKAGYPEAKLRADLADFYRLVGGKVPEVEIETSKSGRAHADGIGATIMRKTIAAGKNFNRAVLFHELAHHFEADATASAAANGYLVKRRHSTIRSSLRSITGNPNFDPSEGAYVDDFLNPYMGKFYPGGETEVFSMGVQYLADPEAAAVMVAKDPELFALITGYLTQDATPAMQAVLSLQRDTADSSKTAAAATESAFKDAIDRLAAKAPLVATDWFDTLDHSGRAWAAIMRVIKRGSVPTYVGSGQGDYAGYHVLTATLRDENTRRQARGHLVVHITAGSADTSPIHDGLNAARALIALSAKDQIVPKAAFFRYFYRNHRLTGDNRLDLIDKASALA